MCQISKSQSLQAISNQVEEGKSEPISYRVCSDAITTISRRPLIKIKKPVLSPSDIQIRAALKRGGSIVIGRPSEKSEHQKPFIPVCKPTETSVSRAHLELSYDPSKTELGITQLSRNPSVIEAHLEQGQRLCCRLIEEGNRGITLDDLFSHITLGNGVDKNSLRQVLSSDAADTKLVKKQLYILGLKKKNDLSSTELTLVKNEDKDKLQELLSIVLEKNPDNSSTLIINSLNQEAPVSFLLSLNTHCNNLTTNAAFTKISLPNMSLENEPIKIWLPRKKPGLIALLLALLAKIKKKT